MCFHDYSYCPPQALRRWATLGYPQWVLRNTSASVGDYGVADGRNALANNVLTWRIATL